MAKPNNGKTSAHVTGAQLARHIALSPQMISRLVKAGVVAPEPDGRFDLDVSRIAYIQNLRRRSVSKVSAEDAYRALKSRKLAIEVAQLDGRLVDLEEAGLFYDMLIASFRASLHGLGSRLGRTAAEKAKVDTVTHAILTGLSDDFGRQFDALRTTGKLPDSDDGDEDIEDADEGETDDPISRPHAN